MRTNTRKTRHGPALLATFAVVVLIAVLGSTLYRYSSRQLRSAVKTRDFLKAKAIAEAGANRVYNRVKFDFARKDDPTILGTVPFGGGTYDVDIQTVGTNKARLIAVGKCGLSEATVKLDLLNLGKDVVTWINDEMQVEPSLFTNYAILTGEMIEWGGGGEIRGRGKVRTNNRIDMVGGGEFRGVGIEVLANQNIYIQGSSKILGTARAPSFSGKTDQITTKVIQAVPFVTIPKIEFAPFYERARTNLEVKTGSPFHINSDYAPAGGVLYVIGSLKISNGQMTGCFVATEGIEISTSRTMTPVNGYPLLMSLNGTIKISSTPTMSGLIYAGGGMVDWQGGGTLTGSIIASGKLDKNGGSDLIINFNPVPPVIPDMPIALTNSADYVIISAWQS